MSPSLMRPASRYMVQAALGYVVMLLAMTYQFEIFVSVIVGFGVGYGLFNSPPYSSVQDPGMYSCMSDCSCGTSPPPAATPFNIEMLPMDIDPLPASQPSRVVDERTHLRASQSR